MFGAAACGGDDEAETTAAVATPTSAEIEQVADASADAGETHTEPAPVPAPEGSMAANAMVLGSDDAPLTIIEYASVTCPACAAFHAQIFPEIKERFIDTGQVRFEYREFPTNPQNLAYAGFYLARCAATTRGAPAYFAMLDTLYARQRDWAYGPTPGEVLENIAAQAGIDRDGLEQCFYREDIKEAVRENIMAGIEEHEVNATPTLIVDGEPFDWDRNRGVEGMIAAIEAELAERQE
jgi:protein-disulfide isomerase